MPGKTTETQSTDSSGNRQKGVMIAKQDRENTGQTDFEGQDNKGNEKNADQNRPVPPAINRITHTWHLFLISRQKHTPRYPGTDEKSLSAGAISRPRRAGRG